MQGDEALARDILERLEHEVELEVGLNSLQKASMFHRKRLRCPR